VLLLAVAAAVIAANPGTQSRALKALHGAAARLGAGRCPVAAFGRRPPSPAVSSDDKENKGE